MKVRVSVVRICSKCVVFKRHGILRTRCEDPKHKQRQKQKPKRRNR